MKSKFFTFLTFSFIYLSIAGFTGKSLLAENVASPSDNEYEKLWKEVDQLNKKGLPKSALEVVEKIYIKAKKENNTPEFIKAILYKLKLQSDFEEDFLVKAIDELKDEISVAGEAKKQILHSILAEMYWNYFQMNRYVFYERSVTEDLDNDDIATWDLEKIMKEIIDNYMASLEDDELLKKTKLSGIDIILEKEEGSQKYRPTLYDFLAHRAVDFFMNDENAITTPAITFEINDVAYLSPASDFINIKLETDDAFSSKYYAMEVLQDLLKFHINDKSPEAFVDVDLKRLNYVMQNTSLDNKDELYISTMEKLSENYHNSPVQADVLYELARFYNSKANTYEPYGDTSYRWENKKAFELCKKAINKQPGSIGANNCMVLKEQIGQKNVEITLEYANLPESPFLGLLKYRNVSDLYFRIIRVPYKDDKKILESSRREGIIKQYLGYRAYREFSIKVPDYGDFQQHATEFKLPELPYGYYVILASPDAKFNANKNIVAYASSWITNLSYVSQRLPKGEIDLYVLDRNSGHPLKGVKLSTYYQIYTSTRRGYEWIKGPEFTSDNKGYVQIPTSNNSKRLMLEFVDGYDSLVTPNYFFQQQSYGDTRKEITQSFFFTDRAIYRPGQTVYFKGIILNNYDDNYSIKANHSTTVTFFDVNNQKISELKLTTNEYGSVNGSFVAPTGVLTGNMIIKNETGSTSFSVEEYKRPKFAVDFEPIKGTYKLNEEILVEGLAKSFAGYNIDNAKVSYRISRQAVFPYWRWWYGFYPTSSEVEISNGTTVTDENGSFSIAFTAIPDASINDQFKPVFNYLIQADVTDINGETHSNTITVSVGETAMLVNINIPEKINQEDLPEITFTTTNLNGENVDAAGNIKIYKLKSPDRIFRSREWSRPDVFIIPEKEFIKDFPHDIYNNEDDPSSWTKEEDVYNFVFNSAKGSEINAPIDDWGEGQFIIELETTDAFGNKIIESEFFTVFSSDNKNIPGKIIDWFTAIQDKAEPGETASFVVGTAEKNVHVIYQIWHRDKLIKNEYISLNNGQKKIEIPILEEFRGNIGVNLVFVKWNRSYKKEQVIQVPYTNKKLDIEIGSFRDKVKPGDNEEWNIKIRDYLGDKVAAEMLASMYDASLDEFQVNSWYFSLYRNQNYFTNWSISDAFLNKTSMLVQKPGSSLSYKYKEYDQLNWFGLNLYGIRNFKSESMIMFEADSEPPAGSLEAEDGMGDKMGEVKDEVINKPPSTAKEESEIPVRRNFNETAFFFPDLKTDEEGNILISFTLPESLTEWKMMGLAYTKDLKVGDITKSMVTQKELMVIPNPPRFFRQGDEMEFAAKIVNLSEETLNGDVTLEFFDAISMEKADIFSGDKGNKIFKASKGASAQISWKIKIPETTDALTYRIVAKSGSFSDGEEMMIPVLTNTMLVTESLPLPINGIESKEFTLNKLLNNRSETLRNFKLSLEFTSNPAWYAIQALPYLMEYPYECYEQVFSRYYANSIATHIMNSNPKIKRVFDSWKNITPDALLSNLEKNQELKSALLEATPWVLEAKDESQRKQMLGVLFDLNNMSMQLNTAKARLIQGQLPNGGFSWFKGMQDNRYITQHIVTGFGKLYNLGIDDIIKDDKLMRMLSRAIYYLDERIKGDYNRIKEQHPNNMMDDFLGNIQVQYLYARTYFLDEFPLRNSNQDAFSYFTELAQEHWLKKDKYMQGMIALATNRITHRTLPFEIIRSLKEHALYDDEMGMYWRKNAGYYWYEAPIETQALMIEAFEEVTDDKESVEKMKIWLLKQKQTQDWGTTKATTDACYSLLLRGTDLLASEELVEIQVGNILIDPEKPEENKVEAGTGYFKTSWNGEEIKPEMGKVKITKKDEGVAWGALYWQYFEDLDKITTHETPLNLRKQLFVEENTPSGPVIKPINEGNILEVGDKVKVRIELRVDRDMEFIHLKDMRASTFEPVNVLSGYRYQDGLGYYESTLDASTDFFIGNLPKGTYVFEYPLVVSQKGNFSNGISTIQCMYAPEFSSHSEGIRVVVK